MPTDSTARHVPDDPWEGIPLSYECCGVDAPGRWHERLFFCPWALLMLVVAFGGFALAVVLYG